MKKLMMCAAFIAAMATFTTVNAQEPKKCTKTEQCDKKCKKADCKKADCKKADCKDCKKKADCKKAGKKACCQQKADKKK